MPKEAEELLTRHNCQMYCDDDEWLSLHLDCDDCVALYEYFNEGLP